MPWCWCLLCAICFRILASSLRKPTSVVTAVLLFALFLVGWGLAFLWGPVGDKFGRVRTLMLTVVWYSVFTFLSALVTNVWQLAVLRLLAGIGIGGEWAMGGTFVAEEWPENRRRAGAGYMHTGYYVGIFLAALLQLSDWKQLRMALDVCCRRSFPPSCSPGCGTASPNRSAGRRRKRRERMADLAAVRDAFFSHTPPSHHFKHVVYAGFDLRPLGRNRLCSNCSDVTRGGGGARGRTRRNLLPARPCSLPSPRFLDASRCPGSRNDLAAAARSAFSLR